MSNTPCTRRRALQLGGAGLLAGLAGCGGVLDSTVNAGDDGPHPLDSVPGNASAVGHVEAEQLLDGPVVQQAVEHALTTVAARVETADGSEAYDGPETYGGALSAAGDSLGLDPEGLSSVTVFSRLPDEDDETLPAFAAAMMPTLIIDADREATAVRDALWPASDFSPVERQYRDATLYTLDGRDGPRTYALGALQDGRVAFGMLPTVEGVADVLAGEATPVEGDARAAYDRAPDGPVRFGVSLSTVPPTFGSHPISDVETVSGGMAVDGDRRRLAVEIDAVDEAGARTLRSVLDGSLSALRARAEADAVAEPYRDALGQVDSVAVERDGPTVTLTHEAGVEGTGRLVTLFAVWSAERFVAAPPPVRDDDSENAVPQASFDIEYDGGEEAVTITHQSGDTIPAADLYVRGTTGDERIGRSWAAFGVEEPVAAGTSVTVENVAPDYELLVIWEPAEADTSAVLQRALGPDA